MARDYPLELFADDIAGVIYGPRNCKVVFTSQQPSRDTDPVETEILTLVMPTDALISFCLYTLTGFAKHGQTISETAQDLHAGLSTAIGGIQELAQAVEFGILKSIYLEEPEPEPAKPAPKLSARKKAKIKTQ